MSKKESVGPLTGLKVLDLSRVLAGPFAGMILCDLGAEVVKIEEPGRGDEARGIGPFKDEVSLYFMSVNRGKKSITLNLKHPHGLELFLQLIPHADILIENYRPGTMDRFGLGYKTLSALQPGLIFAACSGFGQTGPYASYGAYDMIVQAMGGLMSITGQPNSSPVRIGTSIGDLTAALFTVIGILGALHHREKTGRGQLVDIAMLDCQVAILENAIARYFATGTSPQPLGSRHPNITPFEAFETEDGFVVIAVGNNNLWERFCEVVHRPEWVADPRFMTNALRTENHAALQPLIAEVLKQRSTEVWLRFFEETGIPAGPIQDIAQLVAHPQIQARQMIATVVHPDIGEVQMPHSPIRLSETPPSVEQPAPELGEHTQEILMEWCGLNTTQIAQLRSDGVI